MNRNHLGLVFSIHRSSVVDCTYFTKASVFTLYFLYYDLRLCVSLEIIWRRTAFWSLNFTQCGAQVWVWCSLILMSLSWWESVVIAAYASDTRYLSPSFFVFITLPRCLLIVFTFSRVDIFSFDNFFLLAIFRLNHTYSPSSFLE